MQWNLCGETGKQKTSTDIIAGNGVCNKFQNLWTDDWLSASFRGNIYRKIKKQLISMFMLFFIKTQCKMRRL